MKGIACVVAAAGMLVAAAGPAQAWWSFAKWGMNSAQVVAASKNVARPCDPSSCRAPFKNDVPTLYVDGIEAAGLPAKALFAFDEGGKLKATFLTFESQAIIKVNDALSATYGAPVSINRSWPATVVWRDTTKGTTIKSWSFPDSNKIVVEYRPIATGL